MRRAGAQQPPVHIIYPVHVTYTEGGSTMNDERNPSEHGRAHSPAAEDQWTAHSTRKGFLKGAAVAGAGAAGIGALAPAAAFAERRKRAASPTATWKS